MTFAPNDKVWWHDPDTPVHIHHGWVETVEGQGLGVAEIAVPTTVVPTSYVHADADQPPVPSCPLCMASETVQGAD